MSKQNIYYLSSVNITLLTEGWARWVQYQILVVYENFHNQRIHILHAGFYI